MKRVLSLLWLTVFLICLFAYGIYLAQEKKEEKPPVAIRAEITVYSDLPNVLLSDLADRYEEESHVHVNVLPLTEDQLAQHLAEGKQGGDMVITSRDNLFVAREHKQLAPVLTEAVDEVADQFKDADGYWVGLWYDPVIIAQNQHFYKEKGQYITTWHSLALPGDWRVIMTDFVASKQAANLLYNMVESKGQKEAIEYFVQLKPHITQYAKFQVTPIRLAALGEADIGIGNYSDGATYVANKYPVYIIFPADGTAYYLVGAGLLKDAKHPKEALRFLKWLQSKKTADFLVSKGYHFVFTNPEVPKPKDSLGREPLLFKVEGKYKHEGKKALLDQWISQVRFRKGI